MYIYSLGIWNHVAPSDFPDALGLVGWTRWSYSLDPKELLSSDGSELCEEQRLEGKPRGAATRALFWQRLIQLFSPKVEKSDV